MCKFYHRCGRWLMNLYDDKIFYNDQKLRTAGGAAAKRAFEDGSYSGSESVERFTLNQGCQSHFGQSQVSRTSTIVT